MSSRRRTWLTRIGMVLLLLLLIVGALAGDVTRGILTDAEGKFTAEGLPEGQYCASLESHLETRRFKNGNVLLTYEAG